MEFTKKGCNWNWGFREAWLGKTVSDNWIFSECETDNGSLVEQLSYIGANAEQIMDISSGQSYTIGTIFVVSYIGIIPTNVVYYIL